MSKTVFFSFLMMFGIAILAQDGKAVTEVPKQKGMVFFQGTWAELLKESQQTGKPIFLDAYAAWCGPCRMMAANTFPDEEVGKFYNEHFVNYKLDMEKGEGPALKMKYKVTHYPTYLFLDSQGNLRYRKVGYMAPEVFIQEGKAAVKAFKSTN